MKRIATACATATAIFVAVPAADAKTPGRTYCFNGVCHTVKTLEETRRLVGKTTTLKASHYDDAKKDRFNPSNLTSSGEYFRAGKPDNAASPIYPNGTKLLVWHPGTRKALAIRINNAGPYWGDRKLDLSRAAAAALGMGGVATLHVRVLEAPSHAEATYSKGRTYAPVKGYMGQFATLDAAYVSANGNALLAPVAIASAEKAAPSAKVAQPASSDGETTVATSSSRTPPPATAVSMTVAAADEKLPPESPIEISAAARGGKGRKDDGENPIAEAIRRLAEREVQTYIRVAQLR